MDQCRNATGLLVDPLVLDALVLDGAVLAEPELDLLLGRLDPVSANKVVRLVCDDMTSSEAVETPESLPWQMLQLI